MSCAIKRVQRAAKTGSAAPGRQGRPPGTGKVSPHMAMLIRRVALQPDLSMPELATKLEAGTRTRASRFILTAAAGSGFAIYDACWHRNADAMMSAEPGRDGS